MGPCFGLRRPPPLPGHQNFWRQVPSTWVPTNFYVRRRRASGFSPHSLPGTWPILISLLQAITFWGRPALYITHNRRCSAFASNAYPYIYELFWRLCTLWFPVFRGLFAVEAPVFLLLSLDRLVGNPMEKADVVMNNDVSRQRALVYP